MKLEILQAPEYEVYVEHGRGVAYDRGRAGKWALPDHRATLWPCPPWPQAYKCYASGIVHVSATRRRPLKDPHVKATLNNPRIAGHGWSRTMMLGCTSQRSGRSPSAKMVGRKNGPTTHGRADNFHWDHISLLLLCTRSSTATLSTRTAHPFQPPYPSLLRPIPYNLPQCLTTPRRRHNRHRASQPQPRARANNAI